MGTEAVVDDADGGVAGSLCGLVDFCAVNAFGPFYLYAVLTAVLKKESV